MATVASLHSELRSLGSLSKRHNPELAQSSDKSSSILDAASQSFDNDSAVIASLRRYEDFATPFILACKEASAKSCASALQCIQILATYKAIAPSRLPELLSALMEATQLGLGIQLKILQVLPVILFEFSGDLSGELIVELLQVCAELLGTNKVAMVHNAAYATLQQLITGVFDRTSIPESEGASEPKKTIVIDAGEKISFEAPPRLYDSAMVWLDLCDIIEKLPPKFLRIKDLPLTFTLELLELTFANQAALIHKHKELATILRARVTPLLLRLFSEAAEFPIVLRVVRIFYLLLRQHLDILTTESEVILSTLAQGSLHGSLWKRVTCLEVLQGVLLEVDLLYQIYSKFDGESGRLNVILTIATDFAETMSRDKLLLLASEVSKEMYDSAVSPTSKPASTATAAETAEPSTSKGTSGGTDPSMILNKNSATVTPVIEMLDRVEPPKIKRGHPYYLIIKCINSLADDIHRLASSGTSGVSSLLQSLGHPLVKCFSVALSVAMDLELFRLVVRAVQRLAHAAGIANNRELRDELIVLLAQYCYIPDDSGGKPWILGRCSLCVRALFNLGYALGNQLDESWSLIVGAINRLNQQIVVDEPRSIDLLFGNSRPEYRNMNIALKKLIESTTSHSSTALNSFMNAIGEEQGELQYIMLQEILRMNAARFTYPDSKCWHAFQTILLAGVREDEDPYLAFNILNEASLTVLETVTSSPESRTDEHLVDECLAMVIGTISGEMKSTKLSVRISTINHLNTLIDKFGAWMSLGWEVALGIVSFIPTTDELDLMRPAFHTLELICSDFLDRLPYKCVFDLSICLDEFSRQTCDLNISFTSTSLFWSICDHLMAVKDVGEINSVTIASENDLVAAAKDDNSSSKRLALWLLAVTRLAHIARSTSQQQVRTSAMQIFLRLFNTHGSNLTPGAWDTAHKLVFPALLQAAESSDFNNASEVEETSILVIDGVSKISLLFRSQFVHLESVQLFWQQWMQFLNSATPKSAKIAATAYSNIRVALESDPNSSISRHAVGEFWVKQNPRPSFSVGSPRLTADALRELASMYHFIREDCDDLLALKLLTDCALFPYYTTPAGQEPMSGLQLECTKALESFKNAIHCDIVGEYLLSLNRLALSPYASEEFGNEKDNNSQGRRVEKSANFSALSNWALNTMLSLLTDDKLAGKELSDGILEVAPLVLRGMNKVSSMSSNRIVPARIFLRFVELSPSVRDSESGEIVENIRLVLDGVNKAELQVGSSNKHSEIEVMEHLELFIRVLKSKNLSNNGWVEMLVILLRNSVLYERSIHNLKFYDRESPENESTLQYGTVDPPRPIHSKNLSFFCLGLLRKLGTENKSYSLKSSSFFNKRARAVLCQYMGECAVLGQEPLRALLYEELVYVLKELIVCKNEMVPIQEGTYNLLLGTLSNAHRELLPLLQTILKT